jgi:hypothetical protein
VSEAELRQTIAGRLGFWALAAEVQRDRVIEGGGGDFMNQLDATFLAIAIRNVVRAARWAEPLEANAVKTARAEFDSRVPNAVDVRNMLEHFDKYEMGKGDLQIAGKVRNYSVYTARVENEYVLHLPDGYELDVQSAVNATEALADSVANALIGHSERPALGP